MLGILDIRITPNHRQKPGASKQNQDDKLIPETLIGGSKLGTTAEVLLRSSDMVILLLHTHTHSYL